MSSCKDQEWKKNMEIALNFTNMMESVIGSEHGISEEEIEKITPRMREIAAQLKEQRNKGGLPFLDLPYQDDLVRELKKLSEEQKGLWDNLVILGIGGSALGGIALHRGLNHPFYNTLSSVERGGYPRLFFADNIDPDGFHSLLTMLDLKKTLFNVISKSGETAETMSQFLIVLNLLKKHLGEEEYGRHLIITTDKKKGATKRNLTERALLKLYHPRWGGGKIFTIYSGRTVPCGNDRNRYRRTAGRSRIDG